MEQNYLRDYVATTELYRQGAFQSQYAYCDYYDKNGDFKSKNLQLLFNEKDICISAKNTLIYDDEKQLIDYMNDHFIRLSSTK